MNCNNCIHKDVCYKIEHYGRDLKSEEPCEEYVGKIIYFNHIDGAIHNFNDLVIKNEEDGLSEDEVQDIVLFNFILAKAIMIDSNVPDTKALAQILLAESTKNDVSKIM